jgi:hypothetical protein
METPTKIKRINGYTALGRYMRDELYARHLGYVPRYIRTPYTCSPTHVVYKSKTGSAYVIICETLHARYDVFAVAREDIRRRESEIIGSYADGCFCEREELKMEKARAAIAQATGK